MSEEQARPKQERRGHVEELAQNVQQLGLQIVDAAGRLSDVSGRTDSQLSALSDVENAAKGVTYSRDAILNATAQAQEVSTQADEVIRASKEEIDGSLEAINSLSDLVHTIAQEVNDLTRALDEVSAVAQKIDAIAKQTNLLALNATIEAARAGEAGRGFAVVAGEVKALATQTSEATSTIESTLGKLNDQILNVAQRGEQAEKRAATVKSGTTAISDVMDQIATTVSEVSQEVGGIGATANEIGEHSATLDRTLAVLHGDLDQNIHDLKEADHYVSKLVDTSEVLVKLTTDVSLETADTPYIRLVQQAAGDISKLFEEGVESGAISMGDLFDEDYKPIPDTDPAQVTTRFVHFTDKVLPSVQEPSLTSLPRLGLACACDRNGYIGTHNAKFCHPQKPGEVEWNTANSRYRRLFNDRVGLASGRDTSEFLVQIYRRDMGGGTYVLMKNISAPITVKGKHWGGFRIAYSVER